MSAVLILWAFLDPDKRKIWIHNRKIICLLSLYPLALFFNLFSVAGMESSLKMAYSWYWPLIAAPAFCVWLEVSQHRIAFQALTIGLSLAVLKAFHNLYLNISASSSAPFMSENFRIASFWDISRWGFFSGFALIGLFLLFINPPRTVIKKVIAALFILTAVAFVLTNSRAPILALAVVFILLSLTQLKIFKYSLLLLVFGVSFLLVTPTSLNRIKSIFSVTVAEKVTSSNESNAARLHMWKVAHDFYQKQPWFGTGFESMALPLKNFLEKKDATYLQNYTATQFSYNDSHSSYLNILIQMGTIYFLLFWGIIFWIIITGVKNFILSKDDFQRFALAGISYCLIIFVFYSSVVSYESIIFFSLMGLLTIQPNANVMKNT